MAERSDVAYEELPADALCGLVCWMSTFAIYGPAHRPAAEAEPGRWRRSWQRGAEVQHCGEVVTAAAEECSGRDRYNREEGAGGQGRGRSSVWFEADGVEMAVEDEECGSKMVDRQRGMEAVWWRRGGERRLAEAVEWESKVVKADGVGWGGVWERTL